MNVKARKSEREEWISKTGRIECGERRVQMWSLYCKNETSVHERKEENLSETQ